MTENQKLREALCELMSIVSIHQRATRNNFAWAEMAFAREAIALPTAPERASLELTIDFLIAEQKQLRAYIAQLEQPSGIIPDERAAPPSGERYSVKHEITQGGYRLFTVTDSESQCSEDVFPDDSPVLYGLLTALQARAALSAGDAGKFNKLFEAMDEGRASIIVEGDTRSIDGGEIFTEIDDALDALDAAMRKDKP